MKPSGMTQWSVSPRPGSGLLSFVLVGLMAAISTNGGPTGRRNCGRTGAEADESQERDFRPPTATRAARRPRAASGRASVGAQIAFGLAFGVRDVPQGRALL